MSRATRKRRTRGHVIADLAVNHVERQVLLAGHVLQPIVQDYGIDLAVFTFGEEGAAESGQILMQVKATDSQEYWSLRSQSRISEFSSTLTVRVPMSQVFGPETVNVIRGRKNRSVPSR